MNVQVAFEELRTIASSLTLADVQGLISQLSASGPRSVRWTHSIQSAKFTFYATERGTGWHKGAINGSELLGNVDVVISSKKDGGKPKVRFYTKDLGASCYVLLMVADTESSWLAVRYAHHCVQASDYLQITRQKTTVIAYALPAEYDDLLHTLALVLAEKEADEELRRRRSTIVTTNNEPEHRLGRPERTMTLRRKRPLAEPFRRKAGRARKTLVVWAPIGLGLIASGLLLVLPKPRDISDMSAEEIAALAVEPLIACFEAIEPDHRMLKKWLLYARFAYRLDYVEALARTLYDATYLLHSQTSSDVVRKDRFNTLLWRVGLLDRQRAAYKSQLDVVAIEDFGFHLRQHVGELLVLVMTRKPPSDMDDFLTPHMNGMRELVASNFYLLTRA